MSTAETERRKQRVSRVPDKASYTLPEVCEYANTQPYVVRFWESEFPQLRPIRERGGPSVYSRRDLDLVLRIKSLLDGEERTISEARRMIAGEPAAESSPESAEGSALPRAGRLARVPRPRREPLLAPAEPTAPVPAPPAAAPDAVARERYEGALEEIAHLRLELSEALTQRRKAEAAARAASEAAESAEARVQRAAALLEALIARLA